MAHSNGANKSQKGQQVLNFDENQAREWFESLRWPNGPGCVHCGSVNVCRMEGQKHRAGLLQCRDCRQQFTVTVGTVMEDSHLPLATWAKAFHLMASAKKSVSALQLQRNLGLGSYRTAWHLAHRIREAMRAEPVASLLKGRVEVDEAYFGPIAKKQGKGRGTPNKACVVALIERDGMMRVPVVPNVTGKTLKGVVRKHVDRSATLNTDNFGPYRGLKKDFAAHETVNHSIGEYARGETHVNSCESFFGLMRRGVIGSFHHISVKHTPRYADEFAFRWNGRKLNDTERRDLAVKGAEGKRLLYRMPRTRADGLV